MFSGGLGRILLVREDSQGLIMRAARSSFTNDPNSQEWLENLRHTYSQWYIQREVDLSHESLVSRLRKEANACWLPHCSSRHTSGPLPDKAHNQVDFLYTKGHMPFHPFSQSEGTRPARRNALCRVLILGLLFGVRNGQMWSKDMQNVGNVSCLRANVQKTQRCTCPRRIGLGLCGRKWRMFLRQP